MTKWRVPFSVGMLFSLGVMAYLAFGVDNHMPERQLDNNLLNGCYSNGVETVKVEGGFALHFPNGVVTSLGRLSRIKNQTYVNADVLPDRFKSPSDRNFIGVTMQSGLVKRIVINSDPAAKFKFEKVKSCEGKGS